MTTDELNKLKSIIKKYEYKIPNEQLKEKLFNDEDLKRAWDNMSLESTFKETETLHTPLKVILKRKISDIQEHEERIFREICILIRTMPKRDQFKKDIFNKDAFNVKSHPSYVDRSDKDTTENQRNKLEENNISTQLKESIKDNEEQSLTKKSEFFNEDKVTIAEPEDKTVLKNYNESEKQENKEQEKNKQKKKLHIIEDNDHYDLKNGKVGEKYTDQIDLNKIFHGEKVRDYTIDKLNELGLDIDIKSGQITGLPEKQGDPAENFEFELVVRYETEEGIKKSRKIFLKILPDPKSLWKEIEPPQEIEDRKEHEYSKQICIKEKDGVTEKTIIAASKRGRSHAHKGSFRDDHVSVANLSDIGWSILAVSDGAGSSDLSRVASEIACETAISSISKKLITHNENFSKTIEQMLKKKEEVDPADNELKKLLYEILSTTGYEVAKAIHEEISKRSAKMKQFYATYLTAIHKKFDFGNFFAGFWVGDGALAVYEKGERVKLLGTPDEGEFSGQTRFIIEKDVLTSEELMKRISYVITDKFTALFAMSDGVSDPKFETPKNLGDLSHWDALWDELEKEVLFSKENNAKNLLKWLDFWAEGEHDDRTIAVLY